MIEKLIKKVAKKLDKKKIPYMIIGGQAVLLYGSPRLTRDIDITLGVDTDQYLLLKSICDKLKLRILPPKPEEFTLETKVLPVEDEALQIRVDFIFSFSTYEQQAIKRAKKVLMDGYRIKFASPEDLIIHKLIAGRAVDQEDVRNILLKKKSLLDRQYIKKWLKQFTGIEGHKRILETFEKLLKSN